MRFDRRPKFEEYTWTRRKLQAFMQRAARRRQRLERAAPLLATVLHEEPSVAPNPDVELAQRQASAAASEQRMRDLDAKHWRQARSAYFACPAELRAVVRRAWLQWRGPATAFYFGYVVSIHDGSREAQLKRLAQEEQALRDRIAAERTAQGQLPLGR